MSFSIEKPATLSKKDLLAAAELTAKAFGRPNDLHNLQDTTEHLLSADALRITRNSDELIAFAAFRRLLWQ